MEIFDQRDRRQRPLAVEIAGVIAGLSALLLILHAKSPADGLDTDAAPEST